MRAWRHDRIERVAREAFGFERCARASARRSRPCSRARHARGDVDRLGKSAIYQIAGLLTPGATRRGLAADRAPARPGRGPRRARGRRRGAAQLHVRAAERERALAELAEDALEFLFLAPEQLANPRVLDELAVAARRRCWSSTRRTASPSGATTSGPTTCARRGRRGARAPDDPRPHRHGRAAGARRDRRAARPARPRGDHPRLRPPEHPPRASSASTARQRRAQAARAGRADRRAEPPGIVYVATRRQRRGAGRRRCARTACAPRPTTRA